MHNLILVTVDCLRADHLGCYGYRLPTTPFLDRLSRTSWRFERAIVAGTPTYYSFPAILASRYPLSLGRNVVGLAPGEATLATGLRQAGYTTAAWIAGNPYLSARERYHQGFDLAEDFLSDRREPPVDVGRRPFRSSGARLKRLLRALLGSGRTGTHLYRELIFFYWCWWGRQRPGEMTRARQYPAADAVVGQAREWLRERAAEPFFLWLHMMDPHHPYFPPEEGLALLGRSDLTADRAQVLNALWGREDVSRRRLDRHRDEILALYDAGIRWVDDQIGELVSDLRAAGRWERTLFALTADHGEEFLDHGGRYHYPVRLSPELTRVPLLIHGPAVGGEVPGLFSLIDLAPTLLDMLDVESPPTFSGESRWRRNGFEPRPYAVTECVFDRRQPWAESGRDGARLVAIQNQEHKLVVNFATGDEQLFDLVADPGETSPLAEGAALPAHRKLLAALRQHLRHHRPDPRSRPYLAAQLAASGRSLAAASSED